MIKYFPDVTQGSQAWIDQRCGLLTSSEMKLIITAKKLEYAQNEKEKSHLYEIAAQRTTKHVELHYIGEDMLRGTEDEIYARAEYEDKYAPVKIMGFITNDKWGFTLGYSPDGLVGDEGAIEIKSRKQKFQFETIATNSVPEEYVIQIQTELLVSERAWVDFISYSGGMPMATIRVYPDEKIQAAILKAAAYFHEKLDMILKAYDERLKAPGVRLIPTERRIEQEMHL